MEQNELAYRIYSEKIDKKIKKLDKFEITPYFSLPLLKNGLKKTKSRDAIF